jgi:hypothetical protein
MSKITTFRKLFIRYVILTPIAVLFVAPIISLAWWMNPVDVYKSLFDHLRSGESLGILD